MKILLPYISRSGENIDSKIISGGLEKFAQNVFNLFPDEIIPVKLTKEDRINRRTKQIFLDYVNLHKPDIILLNDIDGYFHIPLIKYGIPTILIIHEGLTGDIRYLGLYKNLHEFLNHGGQLYFVSENQYEYHNKHIKRITGKELSHISGFINSSYVIGNENVNKHLKYDAITIGRTDELKNPFYIHKKLKDTGLTSCVITNKTNFQHNTIKYYEDNLHWVDPQFTLRGLSYDDTMSELSSARCYISTCEVESWGITALEALSRGVPLILVTNNTGKHSSEIIAADASHYRIVHKSIKSSELKTVIQELSAYTHEQRLKISTMTLEKHASRKFRTKFDDIFKTSLMTTLKKSTLDSFF